MKEVLIVCTGNVCRSPMAAALFHEAVRRHGDDGRVRVSSAGTWALEGQPASGHAQTLMARRGLDLAYHRGQMITPEKIAAASLILVMTENHRQALAAEFPLHRGQVHLVSELEGQKRDIADPYGGSLAEYELCADQLQALIDGGYPRLLEWLDLAPGFSGSD